MCKMDRQRGSLRQKGKAQVIMSKKNGSNQSIRTNGASLEALYVKKRPTQAIISK